jgi:RNA polymerase subunit RPABC4/transcription elongation factor Spt4
MSNLGPKASVVPAWAWVIAVGIVVAGPIGMTALMQLNEANPPPVAFSIAFGLFIGALLAIYVLAIGYVNRDAKRRGMKAWLWTLIAIFVPNALGIVLYFLMREPLRSPCPSCGQLVQPTFNYCPACHHPLKPVCPSCGKALADEHTFCPYCGASAKSQA